MKRNFSFTAILLLSLLSLTNNTLQAQQPSLSEGLSAKISGGLTTFHGELGLPGLGGLGYTKAGMGVALIKMFTPAIGLQANYFNGNLYAVRDDISQYFNGTLQEFGLSGRLEPLQLFSNGSTFTLQPFLRAGIATTSFRSVRRDVPTNTVYLPAYGYQNDGITRKAAETAMSIPIGVGLSYRINNNICIELEQCMSWTNTDILDAFVGTGQVNDMFGFTNIGLKYTFEPFNDITASPRAKRQSSKPSKTNQKTSRPEGNSIFGKLNKTKSTKRGRNEIEVPVLEYEGTDFFVQSTMPETVTAGKVFETKLIINKGDYTGPAILTQTFPAGFTGMESEIGTASFSFINQKAWIIWDEMPADSVISYSYLVRPNESVKGSQTVQGSVEYRDGNSSQRSAFDNYMIVENFIESDMDAKILEILGPGKKEEGTEEETEKGEEENLDLKIENLLKKYGTDPVIKEAKTIEEDIKIAEEKPQLVVPGVDFRIQIGAFRSGPEGKKMVGKYGLTERITEELHNGWYKYTVGSFRTYADAVAYRDSFIRRSKIWSAFIVGYQDGKRVSNLSQIIR